MDKRCLQPIVVRPWPWTCAIAVSYTTIQWSALMDRWSPIASIWGGHRAKQIAWNHQQPLRIVICGWVTPSYPLISRDNRSWMTRSYGRAVGRPAVSEERGKCSLRSIEYMGNGGRVHQKANHHANLVNSYNVAKKNMG